MITRRSSNRRTTLAVVFRASSRSEMARSSHRLIGVDEADEIDAVPGVRSFFRDQLADITGTNNHRVLKIGRCAMARPLARKVEITATPAAQKMPSFSATSGCTDR